MQLRQRRHRGYVVYVGTKHRFRLLSTRFVLHNHCPQDQEGARAQLKLITEGELITTKFVIKSRFESEQRERRTIQRAKTAQGGVQFQT